MYLPPSYEDGLIIVTRGPLPLLRPALAALRADRVEVVILAPLERTVPLPTWAHFAGEAAPGVASIGRVLRLGELLRQGCWGDPRGSREDPLCLPVRTCATGLFPAADSLRVRLQWTHLMAARPGCIKEVFPALIAGPLEERILLSGAVEGFEPAVRPPAQARP